MALSFYFANLFCLNTTKKCTRPFHLTLIPYLCTLGKQYVSILQLSPLCEMACVFSSYACINSFCCLTVVKHKPLERSKVYCPLVEPKLPCLLSEDLNWNMADDWSRLRYPLVELKLPCLFSEDLNWNMVDDWWCCSPVGFLQLSWLSEVFCVFSFYTV